MGLFRKKHEGDAYGYDNRRGSISVNKDEAFTVKAIYNMYNKGVGIDDIANLLNSANIPAKNGKRWEGDFIKGIIHDPLYIGCVKSDLASADKNIAIIDNDTYMKINYDVY